jgi:magnesium transporter
MIRIFKTEDGAMHEKEEMQPGCWIALTNPTASEIIDIADAYQIDPDHLKAPLDEEERSRIEVEEEYTLVLVDIPSIEERSGKDWFVTIPLAIIMTNDVLITVCLEETPVLTSFMDGRVRDFHTFMKTRFILQILYKNATQYLQYLRIIDKKSEVIERKLHQSQKNEELIELLELEKSLVYFTTSLRSNEVVLEKLLRTEKIKKYPEDTDLLEDVIVENKQAIEMAGQHLQRDPQRDHGRLCLGHLQQPEHCHEVPGNRNHCHVNPHHGGQLLWHECEFQGNALCEQSLRVCHSPGICPGPVTVGSLYI